MHTEKVVTYHDVQPPKGRHGQLHRILHVVLLPHVRLRGLDPDGGVPFADQRLRLLRGGEVEVDQEDGGAFGREEEGRFKADPARCNMSVSV